MIIRIYEWTDLETNRVHTEEHNGDLTSAKARANKIADERGFTPAPTNSESDEGWYDFSGEKGQDGIARDFLIRLYSTTAGEVAHIRIDL